MKLNLRTGLTILAVGSFATIGCEQAFAAPDTSTAPMSTVDASKFETIRRKETLVAAKQALMDGDRLFANKDYDAAGKRYQFAIETVTDSGLSQETYERASAGLASVDAIQAQDAAKDGKFAASADLLRQAIDLQPSNPAYPLQLEDLKKAQEAYVEKRRDPEGIEDNPAVTPEFKSRVATVQKLLFQGDRYFETGQYDVAEETYSKILILDPYNKAAREKMDRVERYRYRADQARHDLYETQQFNNLDAHWSEQISPEIVVPEKQVEVTSQPSNRAKITQKLNSIIIDQINFDKIDIRDVMDFLTDKTKELDPTKEGVNFVLRLTSNTPPPPSTPAAGTPATNSATPPPPSPTAIHRLVSINLTKVPLAQVLNIITEQTNLQLSIDDYAVYLRPSVDEGEALTVRTFLAPPSLFQGNGLTTDAQAGQGGFSNVTSVQRDVTETLKNQGIRFPDGATATYLPGSSKLVIRNTPEMLDLVANLIDQFSQEAPEVQITAKVAEFNQDALKAFTSNFLLSFSNISSGGAVPGFTTGPTPLTGGSLQSSTALRGPFYPGSNGDVPSGLQNDAIDALVSSNQSNVGVGINPITGQTYGKVNPSSLFLGAVVDGRGLGVLLNLLNSTTGVSLLSAPSVTTQNNLKANIDIVQEFPYPTVFQAPELNSQPFALNIGLSHLVTTTTPIIVGGVTVGFTFTTQEVSDAQQVSLGLPPTPSEFQTKNVGVSLEVKPTTYPDKRIDLDITKAQVIDFDGFIDYGVPITTLELSTQTTPQVLTQGTVNLPVFNERSVTTRLQVLDGQTAILGGLIREDTQEVKDKVPILGDLPLVGRLFQSNVTERIKKSLIFFITANLIKSNGKPVYTKTLNAVNQEEKLPPLDTGTPLVLPTTDQGGS